MVNKTHFSQRHPFIFGFSLLILAMVLILGAMAFFRFWVMGNDDAEGGFFSGNDRIGVIYLDGFISSSREVNDWVRRLENAERVKGVVLRINSPGGAVAPSQEMFQAVRRLAKVKPVYVSMGSVAASGGYYVACGGTSIWANPASLTGSIGVKLQLTDMQELMSKIGIREQTITSGELKNTGTIFRPMTEEERAYMQQLVDDIHDQFLSDIALSRDMTREEIEPLADGRAMTGRQAVQAGLMDNLGGFEDVLEALERDLGLEPGVELVEGPEESEGFLSRILGVAHEAYVGFIPRHLLRPALSEISIQDAQQ